MLTQKQQKTLQHKDLTTNYKRYYQKVELYECLFIYNQYLFK